MNKIVIIAPANLPIPATKGGAIETLVQHLANQNEICHKIDLSIITPYEETAYEKSKSYSHTHFYWYRCNPIIEKILNRINRHILCPLQRVPFHSNWQGFIINTLKKLDYDKVIVENNIEFLPILRIYIGDRDLICHIHNRFELNEDSLDACDNVFTVSDYIKQEALKQTLYPSDKIEVIKNCVDKNSFTPSAEIRNKSRKLLNLNDDDIAIAFVGRICEMKGVRHLVEAFKLLNNENARLFIVGSLGGGFGLSTSNISPFVSELLKIVEPIKNRVTFTGFMPNERVHEILNAMDIAANPSLYYEAALVSNVEYEAMGLPIITTNRGGIPEYVSPDCGFILNADSDLTNQIHHALETLISNKSIRTKMSMAAIENAQKFYTEQFYNRFIDIL